MRVAEIRELQGKDTFVVKNIGLYPVVGVESGDVPAVGPAGARLLTETSRVTGLGDVECVVFLGLGEFFFP